MPLRAMAQMRPYFWSTGQSAGGSSSTDGQPSCLATLQVCSTSHLSPAVLKHQKQIDCLTRPPLAAAAPAARAARRRWRRFSEHSARPLMGGSCQLGETVTSVSRSKGEFWLSVFSVLPLCLCVFVVGLQNHHRDTKAQRKHREDRSSDA